ncbi:2,3-diaminopropionate biosynthesis protein SbnA [Plantactinospora endophytica]|uniref:2,3-diaminopropionate biosynthesis protein SbnA n=1 Tax=Plantactinospora endophytica TaxID=673535 RepID=UPI00194569E5|nr:2,3-diaminopropionate biosynthesis protein SbnA [Plantactinospora endophytica]
MIVNPQDFHQDDLYVDLAPLLGRNLHLKCEGFNFAGSIKLKVAAEMVAQAERDGTLRPGSTIVESSSGNLGVALSIVAANRGYRFVCVTDTRCNLAAKLMMTALGGQVYTVTEPDPVSGLLGARLRYVRELCASSPQYVWLNQYANSGNWRAHYRHTAPSIVRRFGNLDVLFVGAGTTGTLMGCARYLRDTRQRAKVVAVDAVGSVTFGGVPAPRHIPGLGTSVRPPMLDERYVDDVLHVREADTVRMCRTLAGHGFLFGGSTGTVVSGALDWLAANDPQGRMTAVAIAPDLGERYLESIYQPGWCDEMFGAEAGHLGREPVTGSH